MTFKEFMNRYGPEIDSVIADRLRLKDTPKQTLTERRLWILNDEPLYRWAKSEGVKI